jgi:copper(I)-binding protein
VKLWKLIPASLVAMFAFAVSAAEQPIHVMDAWIREAPPGVSALAGYGTFHNMSKKPVSVVKVESPSFVSVEMHRTEIKDGMARMVQQTRMEIPAGGERKLAPNGDHFMLLNPRGPLKAGDMVEWVLFLDDGSKLPVKATVRKGEPGGEDHSQHKH